MTRTLSTLVWDEENWIGRSGSSGNVVISMQIQGDSLSCTQWLNGLWFPQKSPHAKNVMQMQTVLAFLWKTEKIQTRIPSCKFFRWGPRRFNCIADALTKYAMTLNFGEEGNSDFHAQISLRLTVSTMAVTKMGRLGWEVPFG